MATPLNLKTSAVKVSTVSDAQVVDLSQKPATAKIVRQGFDVPIVTLDPRKVDQFIGGLIVTQPKDVPRVLAQSIAPGTLAAKGAAVDLVLAPRTKIPFDIFKEPHLDLTLKSLEDVQPIINDPNVKKLLLTYDAPENVPAADAKILTDAFKTVGINVDNAVAGKTFDKAFESVRGALAFQ